MLKIKDNVDLKELEKFGFKKETYGKNLVCIDINRYRVIEICNDDKRIYVFIDDFRDEE